MLHGTFNPVMMGGVSSLTLMRVYLVSGSSWTVDATWNSANNTVECIGGGSGAGNVNSFGGGGGGYSKKNNATLTPGASVNYSIGAGGVGVNTTGTTPSGGDTWFGGSDFASSLCGAKGGNGQLGGAAASGIGDVKYSGGSGDYGGGGAAGPNGNGASTVGPSRNGGAGGAGSGGAGGAGYPSAATAGGAGTEWDATHGSGGGGGSPWSLAETGRAGGLYGGAGACGGNASQYGGDGAQGIIVLTWYA